MAMTAGARDELARRAPGAVCCRRAQAAVLLRFTDSLRVRGGRVVIAAELDGPAVARRLRRDVSEVYGQECELLAPAGGPGRPGRWVVRAGDGAVLARRAGLLDRSGAPVIGMPPRVVAGPVCDAVAGWRGAFLAAGFLGEPGRGGLRVDCPGSAAALALAGAARRIGVPARVRVAGGVEQVVIADPDAIEAMLARLGAGDTLRAWRRRAAGRRVTAAGRPGGFADANRDRAARAAATAGVRVEEALHILGEQVPAQLAVAGRLRLAHPSASLDELGRAADPPLSKGAVAGRLRRLLALAEHRAQHPAAAAAGSRRTPPR